MGVAPKAVTELIREWKGGDRAALDRLLPLVHEEMSRLARRHMRAESPGHTLQATALVNEAFIRLADVQIDYQDRTHFMAMASTTMRRILVDHARARKSAKRGGDYRRLTLDEDAFASPDNPAILDLEIALTRLEALNPHLVQGVELVFFGGLSYDEAASVLGISKTALFNDLKLAKAWLKNQMAGIQDDGEK